MSKAIARRYARALYAVAQETKNIDKIGAELASFADAWKSSNDLRAVYENPAFSMAMRKSVIEKMGAKMNLSETTQRLLVVLSDRRRLSIVADVRDAFAAEAAKGTGTISVEVTTASDMSPAYFAELEKTLRENTGRNVILVRKVDPSLVGGVITRIGDTVFDGSIRNRLIDIKAHLLRGFVQQASQPAAH